jgi:acyl-CoA reductase-like NAD-dependent aldehyde dehydrogenase
LIREAIGVAGLIAPRNWPLNQIVTKVAPAIAAGCTMVLKPSEIAPFNAVIFAEVMHAAGDTMYGLADYVQSGDLSHARAIARKLRAGQVHLN